MSGNNFQSPKLIEESKYDSVCALCANEIPKGAPLWWFNQNCYCMEHSKAEITTEGREPAPNAQVPSPSILVSSVDSKFWMAQFECIVAAIEANTRMMEKIWLNERRP